MTDTGHPLRVDDGKVSETVPGDATHIRAVQPEGFRAGEWARLRGTAALPGFPEGDRPCYLIEFPDGVTDFWPVEGGGYEFRKGLPA